jgi:hypothetical protein
MQKGANMNDIKSIEYLREIVKDLGKDTAMDILENISYLLWDNGHEEARFFTDELIEIIDEEF